MKTGQAICSAWYRTTNPKTVISDDDFACLVKMVDKGQLDAFKAGMTRAAETNVAFNMPTGYTGVNAVKGIHYNSGHAHGVADTRQAILTERDNLKELPK